MCACRGLICSVGPLGNSERKYRIAALRQGLQELGSVDGGKVRISALWTPATLYGRTTTRTTLAELTTRRAGRQARAGSYCERSDEAVWERGVVSFMAFLCFSFIEQLWRARTWVWLFRGSEFGG
jgi:hypothetical protein